MPVAYGQGKDCTPEAATATGRSLSGLLCRPYLLGHVLYLRPVQRLEADQRAGQVYEPQQDVGAPRHQLLFRQAGRFFQAEVLFGPAAPGSLRAAVVASLQSLRPEPATDSLAEQCRRRWVSCPEAAWVFQVLNRAGLFHWGNTGSAIQAGPRDPKLDPSRKFDLWTTRGGPLPPAGFHEVAVVDGIAVYGDGNRRRLLWRVQGLNVWVQAKQQRSALPRDSMLTKLVRASRASPFVPDHP
jgi:hypothetical protein